MIEYPFGGISFCPQNEVSEEFLVTKYNTDKDQDIKPGLQWLSICISSRQSYSYTQEKIIDKEILQSVGVGVVS